MDTELHGAFSLSKLETQGVEVWSIGFFPSFSAQSESSREVPSCIPWQYGRTYELDFPTSSNITGVRGAFEHNANEEMREIHDF